MDITIDPNAVRAQSSDTKISTFPGVGFSDFLAGASAPTSTAVGLEYGYQPAAVTQAAISGMSGSLSGSSASGPYRYDGMTPGLYSGSNDYSPTAFGGSYPGVTGAGFQGYPGVIGATGAPSQDYLEKEALFQQMNDANWEMMVAQVRVNEISRNWSAISNIQKASDDAKMNTIRNFKA